MTRGSSEAHFVKIYFTYHSGLWMCEH